MNLAELITLLLVVCEAGTLTFLTFRIRKL